MLNNWQHLSALSEVWLQVTFQRLDMIKHLEFAHRSDKMTSQSGLIKYDGKFYRSIISAWYEQNQRCPLLSYRAISGGNNQQHLKWNVSNLSTVPAAIQFIKVRNKLRRAHVQWWSEGKWLSGISSGSRMWLTDDFGLVFWKIWVNWVIWTNHGIYGATQHSSTLQSPFWEIWSGGEYIYQENNDPKQTPWSLRCFFYKRTLGN